MMRVWAWVWMRTESTHSGARFQFDRVVVQGEEARYRVTVSWAEAASLPAGESQITVTLRPNACNVGEPSGALAPWMRESVTAFARVLAKNYDAEAGWPRLVHRWRPAK